MKKKKVEFHIHTRYSHDSLLGKYFIILMCKLKKIDAIAITDHNEIKGAKKYKEKLQRYGIEVIIGEEIFTNKGEIIGLYLNEKIEPNLSPEETISSIKNQNGLVYIPHPYDEKRKSTVLDIEEIEKLSKEIDFIEIHNGRNVKKEFSDKQKQIADKYRLNYIIGSDAHTFFELGRNNIYVDEINKETLIENVQNGEFKQANCIRFAHICTKITKIIKLIMRGKTNELFKIIHKRFTKGNKETI